MEFFSSKNILFIHKCIDNYFKNIGAVEYNFEKLKLTICCIELVQIFIFSTLLSWDVQRSRAIHAFHVRGKKTQANIYCRVQMNSNIFLAPLRWRKRKRGWSIATLSTRTMLQIYPSHSGPEN